MIKKPSPKPPGAFLKQKKKPGTESERIERRLCRRFKVPGATVHYIVKEEATTEKPVKQSKKPIKTKAKAEKTKEENDEIFDKTLQKLEKIKKQLK